VCVCVVQCDGIGDSSVRRRTTDHNETDDEAERFTARPTSNSSSRLC